MLQLCWRLLQDRDGVAGAFEHEGVEKAGYGAADLGGESVEKAVVMSKKRSYDYDVQVTV